jgi:hypothetical protein
VLEFENWENFVVRLTVMHARMYFILHYLYSFYSVFCDISFLRFCCSQISDHQRRRSHQHHQQQQQQPVAAAVAVTSTSQLSVQILNYEASLLQQQVC